MPVGRDFIYVDPRTPGHVRDVLRTIQEQTGVSSAEIDALGVRVDAIEDQIGLLTRVFDSAAVAGQPVFITAAGNADLASAAALSTSLVIGLTATTTAAAASGGVVCHGRLTLTDWIAVTGSSSLTPGARYFLAVAAGQLTSTAPTTIGQIVMQVGIAVNATTLDVHVHQGILL